MSLLAATLGALLLLSWVYWIVAAAAVRTLFGAVAASRERAPLPAVSILKPVRGVDASARRSLESFCTLAYPRYEVLFGVVDRDDAVLPILEELRARWPGRVRVLVNPPRPSGANRKACLLEALSRAARHEVLVAADADMRVERGYLRRVVSALHAPDVVLVTCPYLADEPGSIWARLEALHMGVTFLPAAVLAARLGVAFAMGATIAVRRAHLRSIGGFAAVKDHLADDYEVGARVAAATGGRVALSPEALRSATGRTSARELWDREVRWSRCNWAGRPAGTLGYALTFSLPLAMAFLTTAPGWLGTAALAATLLVRAGAAAAVARVTGDGASLGALPLLPLRDLLSAAAWLVGRLTTRVVWRGDAFHVDREGRLHPVARIGGALEREATLERHPDAQPGNLE